MTTPYTYQLHFKPTGQHYIGARYALGCHPEELMTVGYHPASSKVRGLVQGGYRTTSKDVVWKLVDEYGLDAFEIVNIKRHASEKEALKYENEILKSLNLAHDDIFLNQHNGAKNFLTKRGNDHPCYGKPHSKASLDVVLYPPCTNPLTLDDAG